MVRGCDRRGFCRGGRTSIALHQAGRTTGRHHFTHLRHDVVSALRCCQTKFYRQTPALHVLQKPRFAADVQAMTAASPDASSTPKLGMSEMGGAVPLAKASSSAKLFCQLGSQCTMYDESLKQIQWCHHAAVRVEDKKQPARPGRSLAYMLRSIHCHHDEGRRVH